MPFYKKRYVPRRRTTTRRSYKRRTVRSRKSRSFNQIRKATNRRKTNVIVPGVRGFLQDRVRTRLVYAEDILFSSSTSLTGTIQFALNGLFDPNLTGVGHQPRFFDQFMTYYNSYSVMGAKVVVRAIVDGDDTVQGWMTVNASTGDTTWGVPGGIAESIEMGNPYKIITNDRYSTFSRYFSVPKIYGRSRQYILDDTLFSGNASVNPSNTGKINIQVQNLDLSTTTTVRAVVTIYYDCIFNSPKLIGSS